MKKINLIMGLVLGVLAIVFLNIHMAGEKEKMAEGLKKAVSEKYGNVISVMIAKENIAQGVVIKAGMLKTEVVPRQYVQPQAVTYLDRVAGMRTAVPIKKGEQITLNKLSAAHQVLKSLAMTTPVGKRAIAITVDNLLTRMIKPGDYVDVIALLGLPAQTLEGKMVTQVATVPLFQNVLVLAIGEEFNMAVSEKADLKDKFFRKKKEEDKKVNSSVVTIALTPQETNLIAFVKEQGKIQLVLRSPADAKIQPLSPVNAQTLIQYLNSLMPSQPQQKMIETEIQQKPKMIEIYRGSGKEHIPISE